METSMSSHIWTQAHFCQLYDEAPLIRTPQTYSLARVLVGSSALEIKIPSGSDEFTYRYLITKAIYNHFLDCKEDNPLLKTAKIPFFQALDGFARWYRLWMRGEPLGRNCTIATQDYSCETGIKGYQIIARFRNSEIFHNKDSIRFLSRSLKTGKYHNITVVQNKKHSRQQLCLLHQHYKQPHPFINSLCEYSKTQQYSYYIFQHHPFSLTQILTQTVEPLKKDKKIALFLQLLTAMQFLEYQKLLKWGVRSQNVYVGGDGHVVVGEEGIFVGDADGDRLGRDGGRENVRVLFQVFSLCIREEVEKQQGLFFHDLKQLQHKQKPTIKQISTHIWTQKQNTHKIFSKTFQIVNPFLLQLHPNPSIIQIQQDEINKYFKIPEKKGPIISESYVINVRTPNQKIIMKYQDQDQDQENQFQYFQDNRSFDRDKEKEKYSMEERKGNRFTENQGRKFQKILRNKSSTSLFTAGKRIMAKQQKNQEPETVQSPYARVLKKQSVFARRKLVN